MELDLALIDGLLERIGDGAERVWRRREVPLVARSGVVLGPGPDGDLHELVLVVIVAAEGDRSLAIERPSGRARGAEHAVVLLEDLADLGHGAVAVVGHALDEKERAAGPVPS